MKIKFTILLGITIALGACSSSAYLADDVYYSPKDEKRAAKKAAKNADAVATVAVAEAVPTNQGFESATYMEPQNSVSGVYNGDTLELETFEYENGDKELVVNNYYDDYYSDNTDYTSRISRFYGPSVGLGYYSPYYGPTFSFGMGVGMGFGFGMGFGYGYGGGYYGGYYGGYPYYPYYNPCYSCYPYYGYGGGYYGGYPGYISDGGAGYTSTHRRSSATGRAMDYSNGGTKSASYYDNSATRRRGVSASAANTALKSRSASTATALAPGNRRNIESRSVAASDMRTTRTLPNRNNNLAQAQNRSANTVNSRSSQSSAKRIPAKTTQASNTSKNQIQRGNTTQKRYIPRYSTPKKTTVPSYNRSGTTRSVNTTRPSSVTRQGYTPTQSRSSFTSPTRTNARSTSTKRSYNPGSSSSGRSYSSPSRSSSSGRSYTPSSSSSGSRSSGSSSGSRSSGSSSSSSGGRRR
ncbi:MAG: hypothetical protein QNK30_06800 [Bacteroidales bacterium]|nr:hypothetical protein [Bacteroidales bacterium]